MRAVSVSGVRKCDGECSVGVSVGVGVSVRVSIPLLIHMNGQV